MIKLNLRDCYRASDVTRWQIVRTNGAQSLAEHSFHVALITVRLCDLLGKSDNFRNGALWYALTHDMAEVLTGDLASPVKLLLGSVAVRKLQKLESELLVLGRPLLPLEISDQDTETEIKRLVKTADLIEAITFLRYGAGSDHGWRIMAELRNRLEESGNPVAIQVLREILDGEETTLDDLIGILSPQSQTMQEVTLPSIPT